MFWAITFGAMKIRLGLSTLWLFLYSLAHAQQGLKGEYFEGVNFNRLVSTRIDTRLDFNWNRGAPVRGLPPTDYSIRWTGKLNAPESGVYRFSATVDDGIRLWVGGAKVIDAWGPHDHEDVHGDVELAAGKFYDIRVEYFNGILEGQLKLQWRLPSSTSPISSWFSDSYTQIETKFLTPPAVVVAKAVATEDVKAPPKSVSDPPATRSVASTPVSSKNAQPAPAGRRMQDTIQSYTPKNILFEPGQPFVLEESYPELDRLVKLLQRFEKLRVTIDGHTDITGNPAINMELSQDRANEVAWYLKEHGIAAGRIKTRGFGSTRPLFGKDSTRLYPQNRRVEFKIE